MLMQGDDMLLAFEVWPSPLFKGLAFTTKGRFCPQALYTLQEKKTCYQVCMQEALMSCVVGLMLRPEALKEVPSVLLKRG